MTPDELTEKGLGLQRAGRLAEAERLYAAAIAAASLGSRVLTLASLNRGAIFLGQNRAADALTEFDRALAANPALAEAWNNRGLALDALRRPDEALMSFDHAIALRPDSTEPHNNRGDTLNKLRRHQEALVSFNRALAIRPDDWAALNNRGIALLQLGRIDEALASYDRALAIRPDIAEALHGRSHILWSEKKELVRSIGDLEYLVTVQPNFPFAPGALMRLKLFAGRWDGYDADKTRLDAGVRAGKAVVEPFIYLGISDEPADLLRCARIYAEAKFPALPALRAGCARRPGRIRVGYVCGEFRAHATAYLSAGLYESHDRARFEIFAFDNGSSDKSPMRRRLKTGFDKFIEIAALSEQAAAERILAEEIDILVDLNGPTGNLCMGIFARRPAPIQVSYLAFPGTLGAPYMDYLLADEVVIPADQQHHYVEKIAWLPHSYQINDERRRIAEQTPSRAAQGLPDPAFIFCNFNNSYKLTPKIFALWMEILGQVDESVLWLGHAEPVFINNLKREATCHGIAPERLIFAGPLPLEEHLARLRLADLFLDELPYNAHTTASDALWAGLPLLTCRGRAFAGRVAASLLGAVGLPELVTENLDEYEAFALRLAREPSLLKSFRDRLVQNRLTSPLFDTRRITRAIESAYTTMFERWQRGETPQCFRVA